MMQKVLLSSMLALMGVGAFAATPSTLVITQRDGQTSKFAIADIDKIWFTATDVVVTATGADTRFSRTAVKSINYGEAAGVDGLTTDRFGVVRIDGTTLCLPADCASLQATVFTAAGSQAMPATGLGANASLDIASLPQGVYVALISDGRTFKFVRK